jgi:RNA polymerase sigma-70 factor (ECF subfamily)
MSASYEADPEVRLMLQVSADVPGAFDALVRRVVDPLTAFLTKQTGDPDVASDLVQETFLRVYRHRSSYRPDARFRTWLFYIAVNVVLNRRRYEGYRGAASLDAEGDDEGASLGARLADEKAADPTTGVERAELAARVRDAVARLPLGQRIAVTLLRFHDLSYEEIARAMELTVPAVKSLLNRAKENLRRALAPEIATALTPEGAKTAKGCA